MPGGIRQSPAGYEGSMTDTRVVYLADHGVWLAIPALLPAVIVAGVVLFIAMRNRRRPNNKQD